MSLRFGVFGANGRQGRRYLDPANWPHGVECFPLARDAEATGDGVIIATPPATHLDIARRCLDLPLLCEKPLALYHLDGIEIVRLSAPLLVAHTHLWDRFFLELPPSPAATVTWCGPERTDGSCPAKLDWGAHAWAMAIALGTERVTTGLGDRGENLVRSGGKLYSSVLASEFCERPMRSMLASFATIARGGEDWRARKSFALAVQERCLRPSG